MGNSLQEIWRNVIGFETHYEVSIYGRVRSKTRVIKDCKSTRVFKSKVLSPGVQSNNYLGVWLYKDSKGISRLVHHLVAEAFIGTRPDNTDVDHINGDRTDNSLFNLRYLSVLKNRGADSRHKNAIRPPKKGKDIKLTQEIVLDLREAYTNGENMKEYARKLGVSASTVHHAVQKRSWQNI